MKSAFTIVESLIVLAIIGLLILVVYGTYHHETVEMPAAYKAWVKQTGNTNDLSYDEWRSLLKAQQQPPPIIIWNN